MEGIIQRLSGLTKSLSVPLARRCLLVYLVYCSFPQRAVKGQGYLVTPRCETTLGSTITLFGNYSSDPGDPVSWVRPDVNATVECQPKGGCITRFPGYNGSQSSSGREYTLTIQETRDVDFGKWNLQDGILILPITVLKAVDLSTVQYTCTSGTQTGENIRIEKGSSDSLMCGTQCISENITISCYVEQNGNQTRFANSTPSSSLCGSGFHGLSSTVGLWNFSGYFNVCCDLTDGDCSFNQTNCKTLTIVELTTTAIFTRELTNSTSLSTGVSSTDSTSNTITVTQDSSSITSVSSTFSYFEASTHTTGTSENTTWIPPGRDCCEICNITEVGCLSKTVCETSLAGKHCLCAPRFRWPHPADFDWDCWVPCNGAIAVLVLVAILLVPYVKLIGCFVKALKWLRLVVALIGCVCAMISLILIAVSVAFTECKTEPHTCEEQPYGTKVQACEVNTCEICKMRTAGVVLYILALLLILLVVFPLKNRSGSCKNQIGGG